MAQFNKAAYSTRQRSLGDEAEGVFEQVSPFGSYERYGWNRPENVSFKHVPAVLRYTPDYYATGGYLVEVMGCGKDDILKGLKVKKYDGLKYWSRLPEVELVLFLWNSYREQYVIVNWDAVKRLVSKYRNKVEAFHDGNEYYPLPWDDILEVASFKGEYHG